nr:hypothetical protein [Tanacetum cinerariifolium]
MTSPAPGHIFQVLAYCDSRNRIEPGSHKEHPKHVDDDDENEEQKKDEKKSDEMGSLENKTEKIQTPIHTTSRSPRINLSSDKTIVQELTDNSEVAALVSKEFDAQAPKIIEDLFKHYIQSNVIQVHPTSSTSTNTTSSADLQQQLYLKMKSNLQDEANNLALWDVLKRKLERSSTSNTSCMNDDFHSQHYDDHQEDDAPPEEEKRVKRHKISKRSKSAKDSSSKQYVKKSTSYVSKQQQDWDAWEEETIIDEDEVIPKDEMPELITEFQNIDKRVLTIFDHARMEATLNDMLSGQFRNAEEHAYHVEQATNFMEI